MKQQNSKQHGFTLLELLIAMTLLGMLLVMLYSGFNVGIRGWDKGEEAVDRLNELRLTQEFLRRHLRQSVTVFRNDERDGRVLYFSGESDKIGWITPMLRYLGLGGLYYLELDLVENDDDGQLRLRWFPYNPSDPEDVIDGDDAEQTILLHGVSDLKIDYFGSAEPDDDPDWHEHWENLQERPTLIRLSLNLKDNAWPDLIVAIVN